ncbi:uncharacterized protein V6R79_021928 [Siganus canaliculatus]
MSRRPLFPDVRENMSSGLRENSSSGHIPDVREKSSSGCILDVRENTSSGRPGKDIFREKMSSVHVYNC